MILRWQTENLLKAEPTPSFLLVTNLDPLSLHTNLDGKKEKVKGSSSLFFLPLFSLLNSPPSCSLT